MDNRKFKKNQGLNKFLFNHLKKIFNRKFQVFVKNSHKTQGIGYPFGYLKLSANLQTVNLFVFPYNYPLLFAIIEEVRDARLKSTPEFKHKVDRYFSNIPLYYVSVCLKNNSKKGVLTSEF